MKFVVRDQVAEFFDGKTVALIGSGPSCLTNKPGFVDSHDVVVRVNNFKTGEGQGFRCDAHYSFYGHSIRKTASDLTAAGVRLALCKCPDAQFMNSRWHRRNGKLNGVDFRNIYKARAKFWFCDTYVPTLAEFLNGFNLLGGHVPTTGFSALLLLTSLKPESIFISGMDFFASKIHNVNERWKPGDSSDPIGHVPERERDWLVQNNTERITFDGTLAEIMRKYT